jgi:hypothetical protein
MAKNIRQSNGNNVQDPSSISALEFSKSAGSKKVSEVGRHLLPIPYINLGSIAYTTDASTAKKLPNAGTCLAVYNNSASLGSITLGSLPTTAPTVLAAGVTDASGNVGIPCAPNAWTYIACDVSTWVIASASTLLTFIIDDETSIKAEVSSPF